MRTGDTCQQLSHSIPQRVPEPHEIKVREVIHVLAQLRQVQRHLLEVWVLLVLLADVVLGEVEHTTCHLPSWCKPQEALLVFGLLRDIVLTGDNVPFVALDEIGLCNDSPFQLRLSLEPEVDRAEPHCGVGLLRHGGPGKQRLARVLCEQVLREQMLECNI